MDTYKTYTFKRSSIFCVFILTLSLFGAMFSILVLFATYQIRLAALLYIISLVIAVSTLVYWHNHPSFNYRVILGDNCITVDDCQPIPLQFCAKVQKKEVILFHIPTDNYLTLCYNEKFLRFLQRVQQP